MVAVTAVSEMHDRIIVAAAHTFGVPLITRDATIRQAGIVECIWD